MERDTGDKFERHRKEAAGVLKDVVGPDRATPAHRLMETPAWETA
jgi:hypothetical protein